MQYKFILVFVISLKFTMLGILMLICGLILSFILKPENDIIWFNLILVCIARYLYSNVLYLKKNPHLISQNDSWEEKNFGTLLTNIRFYLGLATRISLIFVLPFYSIKTLGIIITFLILLYHYLYMTIYAMVLAFILKMLKVHHMAVHFNLDPNYAKYRANPLLHFISELVLIITFIIMLTMIIIKYI